MMRLIFFPAALLMEPVSSEKGPRLPRSVFKNKEKRRATNKTRMIRFHHNKQFSQTIITTDYRSVATAVLW